MTEQQSSIADALRQVAMVADISSTGIGLTRTDKAASKQANQAHSARDGAGKVVVNRFAGADESIKKIMDIQSEAAANLKANTSAWGNSKRRLLPNANFQRWITKHTQLKDAFDVAVQEMVDDADNIIAQAQQNIGSFDIDLPTKREIEQAFSLTYNLEPIPDPSAFGRIMGDDGKIIEQADEHLRWQFEQNVQASYTNAIQDAAGRLALPLEKLAERMEAFDAREKDRTNGIDVGREGYFRDSIITNVQEIAAVFGNLNVLGDPHLAAVAKKCEVFKMVTPDILRKRADVRGAMVVRAKSIIEDLNKVLVK